MVKDHYEVDYEDKCLGIEETFVYTPCKLDGHPYLIVSLYVTPNCVKKKFVFDSCHEL
jgi:hypothetical protein